MLTDVKDVKKNNGDDWTVSGVKWLGSNWKLLILTATECCPFEYIWSIVSDDSLTMLLLKQPFLWTVLRRSKESATRQTTNGRSFPISP